MNDIETAFARIRGEAEQRALPMAEQIRRHSDRRARRTAVGALAAVAIGTVAVIGVLPLVNRQASAPAAPVTAVTPSPSLPPPSTPLPSGVAEPSEDSGCLDRYPARIPTSAFLTEVTADNTLCYTPPPGEPKPTSVLPAVCATNSHPSDALITDRRGVNVMYAAKGSSTPRVYAHTVTTYSGSGASDYLAELRQAVGRCGAYIDGVQGVRGAKYEYAIVSGPKLGDDSIRLTMHSTLQEPELTIAPRSATFYLSVVRKGTSVSVVFDRGWEGTPSDSTEIFDIMRRAAERLPAT